MSGGGVAQLARLRVQINIRGSNILALGVAAESGVHGGEQLRGAGGVFALGDGGHLDHGGDQGGGDAVTGDIGDEETRLADSGGQVVVEVAGDGGHGNVARGDVEVGRGGEVAGEQGDLDAAGQFELAMNLAQLHIAGERAAGGDV